MTSIYPKPAEGEEIPISFLLTENRKIGWSPQEKKSVYIDEDTDINSLKRIRNAHLVKVFNWISGRESIIELSDQEIDAFKDILNSEDEESLLIYSRVKVKGKLKSQFSRAKSEEPRRRLLSEMM